MGAGGKRPGAGRKRGSPNKASVSRELAAQATGMTPRDVMLAAMRHWFARAEAYRVAGNRKLNDLYLGRAVSAAKDAAPFIHPKAGGAPSPDDPPQTVNVKLEVSGGLPVGSTPERPEGTEYSEVPDEQPAWAAQPSKSPLGDGSL
jgi:hypothetical protein